MVGIERTVVKVLRLLSSEDLEPKELSVKANVPLEHLQALLDWGVEEGLWLKYPFQKSYQIGDTGNLLLNAPDTLKSFIAKRVDELKWLEVEDDIPQLLRDPELLTRIREIMDQEIVGEHANKLLLFLIFLSKNLGSEHAQACFIMGESSSGKSYLMHCVLSYFPDDKVIWLTRSTTHGLEYLFQGRDMTGYILAIEEAPGFQDSQPSMRPMFSERGLKIVTAQATGGGKVVSKILEIKGCPAFVTTTVPPMIDDQMSTRVWILSTDESHEQTRQILEYQAKKEKFPGATEIRGDREIVRKALGRLRPVEVLIPFADAIEFPSKRIRVRRDFPKLLTLIKVSAYLHQYQRPHFLLNGKEAVIATFADYHIAMTLAEEVLRPTLLGLSKGVLRVYDICKGLAQGGEEITSRTVTERSEYSQSTVRHYLNELVKARLLLRDACQKEHRFSPMEAEDVALSGITALEERFGEKELKEWSEQMLQNGIAYDEMRELMYSPIPKYNMVKKVGEESSGPDEPVDAALSHFAVSPTRFIDVLQTVLEDLEEWFGTEVPVEELVERLRGGGVENPEELIEELRSSGLIYEPRAGFIAMVR